MLRFIISVILVGVLMLGAGPTAPVQAATKINVSATASESKAAAVGLNGRELFVVYEDTGPGGGGAADPADIFMKRSTNLGGTWTAALNLSGSAGRDSGNYSWSISGDTHYVVWTEQMIAGIGDVWYRRSTTNGTSWGGKINLSNNAGDSEDATVNVAGGGLVYVAWDDDASGNVEIYLRRSTDGGATFLPVQNISNTGSASEAPVMTAFGPFVYVAWTEGTAPNRDVWLARSTNGGATWTKVNVSNSAADTTRPRYTVVGPNVYVTYREGATADIHVRISTNGGTGFPNPSVNLSNNAVHSTSQRVLVSGMYLYVVWLDDAATDKVVLRRSTDAGATWQAAQTLAEADDIDNYTRTLAGLNFLVAWDRQETSTTPFEVFFRRSPDAGATFPSAGVQNLSENGGQSRNPEMLAAGTWVFVVWDDTSSGNREILLARSKSGGAGFLAPELALTPDDDEGPESAAFENPVVPERCARQDAGARRRGACD